MPSLSDRVERVTVTATSPDGNIKATLNAPGQIRCGIRSDETYRAYDATELSQQLTALLCSIRQGRNDGVRQVYENSGWTVANPDEPHWDAQTRRFRAALAETTAKAKSPSGLVLLKASAAHQDFRVHVKPTALETLDRQRFLDELHSGYANLIKDCQSRRSELVHQMLPR